MNTSVTRLDACQSLLVSPSNSTVTTWLTMASRAVMPRSPAPCVNLGTDSVVTNRSGAGGPGGLAADASSRVVSSEPDT